MQKQRIKTRVVDCWRSLCGTRPTGTANWPIVRPKFSIPMIWNKLTQDASISFCWNRESGLSCGNDSQISRDRTSAAFQETKT